MELFGLHKQTARIDFPFKAASKSERPLKEPRGGTVTLCVNGERERAARARRENGNTVHQQRRRQKVGQMSRDAKTALGNNRLRSNFYFTTFQNIKPFFKAKTTHPVGNFHHILSRLGCICKKNIKCNIKSTNWNDSAILAQYLSVC